MGPITINNGLKQETAEASTIVYSTIKAGASQIYSISEDKDVSLHIAVQEGLHYHPAIDSSGQYLVFTSEKNGSTALYVKNLRTFYFEPLRVLEGDFLQDRATFSPDGRTLYFVASRDGVTDIYALPFNPHRTASSQEADNITKGLGGFSPSISPCGNWIAFSSNRHCKPPFPSGPILPGNYKAGNVYLMKLDGLNLQRVFPTEGWQGAPSWSKDGSQIYFYSTVEGKQRLHSCDVNTMQVQLVRGLENRQIISSATKPNGRLAFIEVDGLRSTIASVDLEKEGLDYQVESPYHAMDFTVAPDGIIFGSTSLRTPSTIFGEGPSNPKKPNGVGPLFVGQKEVTLETTGEKLNLIAVRGYFPTLTPQKDRIITYKDFNKIYSVKVGEWGSHQSIWKAPEGMCGLGLSVSPDGKKAVTAVGMPFNNTQTKHLYLIDLETGSSENLTEGPTANDSFPAFTSNGQILFASSRGTTVRGHKNLYLMDLMTRELTRLTETQGVDTMPSMSPKGNKIVFVSQRGEATNHTFNLFMLKLDKVSNVWNECYLFQSLEPFAHPRFSPNGKQIVCSTGLYGLAEETPLVPVEVPQSSGEIVTFDIKTKTFQRLTANMWENSLPHWG